MFFWRQCYIGYNTSYRNIYYATAYELGHHIQVEHTGWSDMDNSEECVKESFATGIGWYFTAEAYSRSYGNSSTYRRGNIFVNYTDVVARLVEAGVSINITRLGMN